METKQSSIQVHGAKFQSAVQLLQSGQPDRALALARQLVEDAPEAADAQQLLAMSLADTGASNEAEAAFRRAQALEPSSAVIASNFAAWLRKEGRIVEAVAVISAAPESGQTKIQHGLLVLQMRDYAVARQVLQRAVQLLPDSPQAWHGLGSALRALDELEASANAFRKATALSPRSVPAWTNLGAVLRLLGQLDEAMSCFRKAESLGHKGPELHDAINGLLTDLGRPADALDGARKLVSAQPRYAPAHETLAHLLWEHGQELSPFEDPLAAFRAAVESQRDNQALWRGFLRMLLTAGRPAEALSVIRSVRTRDNDILMLDWLEAEAHDALGQHKQAAALFSRIYRSVSNASPEFLNAYARHAFKTGEMERAKACVSAVLRRDPHNQEGLCHLGTLWRLAGDEREYWLCDYDRLISSVEVSPPDGFETNERFLETLQTNLNNLHSARREPVNQSVRHGSQTAGRLFGRADPLIAATQAVLHEAVERWAASLPEDPEHPFLSRRRRRVRMVGSWSVKLWNSGRHSNHFHSEGWASSAYYVSLPDSVRRATGNDSAGCIQFGQPLEKLGLDLPPRRVLRPKPGYLVLFPSYFWHGTLPFSDSQPRLTIAFDAQPTAH